MEAVRPGSNPRWDERWGARAQHKPVVSALRASREPGASQLEGLPLVLRKPASIDIGYVGLAAAC